MAAACPVPLGVGRIEARRVGRHCDRDLVASVPSVIVRLVAVRTADIEVGNLEVDLSGRNKKSGDADRCERAIELSPKRIGQAAASATQWRQRDWFHRATPNCRGPGNCRRWDSPQFTNACEEVAGAGPMVKFTEFDPAAPGEGFSTSITIRPT